MVDSFGAFVSPTGDDGNPGTKAKPFKTIAKALGTTQPRIVVCEGIYAEALDIKRSVELYGGIACSFDKAGKKPSLTPDAATALVVSSGTVKLFDVEVVAKSATADGASSIGILAKTGTTLELTRARVEAGDAADGADAPTADNNHFANPAGNASSGNTGGALKTCACPAHGTSTGGGGGNGGTVGNPIGQNGSPGGGTPTAPTMGGFTGAGGTGAQMAATACTPGTIGSPGTARLAGAGAMRLGTISDQGWSPAGGLPGEAGNPGQGGGGGGGAYYLGVNGAGGGGGGGGGGAGGLVAGIAYSGVVPKVDAKETAAADVAVGMTLGAPGLPGGGGVGGDKSAIPVDGFSGATGASGLAGVAKAVIKVEK